MLSKLNDYVAVFLSGVILAAVLYAGWCDILDGKIVNPVLEFGERSKTYTHNTTKEIYHPGEMVEARILFQKNRPIRGKIQWYLVNSRMTMFAARDGCLPAGIWDKVVKVEKIPEDTEPGEHWFAGSVTYKPNWLGTVTYPIWTNKFKIIKKN